jgi:phospho-N-acetylmuramoyl-pentapeptide-transferase
LDGLAWWLMTIILACFAAMTFLNWTYLASSIVWILVATLLAFLFFNINPAKLFMWDSWAFALWWMLSSLIYLMNMRFGILIPFLIIFGFFIVEFFSSFLQIFWKKVFKKKLFTVAPFHHLLEYKWMKETTIVMEAWLIQWILAAAWMLLILIEYIMMKKELFKAPFLYIISSIVLT